jgi:hypothetical protein
MIAKRITPSVIRKINEAMRQHGQTSITITADPVASFTYVIDHSVRTGTVKILWLRGGSESHKPIAEYDPKANRMTIDTRYSAPIADIFPYLLNLCQSSKVFDG